MQLFIFFYVHVSTKFANVRKNVVFVNLMPHKFKVPAYKKNCYKVNY